MPQFKTMNDDALRAAYRGVQIAMYNNGEMARSVRNPKHRQRLARAFGRCLRDAEIIEAIARKRGIRL